MVRIILHRQLYRPLPQRKKQLPFLFLLPPKQGIRTYENINRDSLNLTISAQIIILPLNDKNMKSPKLPFNPIS